MDLPRVLGPPRVLGAARVLGPDRVLDSDRFLGPDKVLGPQRVEFYGLRVLGHVFPVCLQKLKISFTGMLFQKKPSYASLILLL